jgi:F0F1-type ATP synthase membrane subunit b/b'
MKGLVNMAKTRQTASIDDKIAKAQGNVERSKLKYDAAVTELKQLLEKREAMRKDVLINAITRSKRSYDEILDFLKTDASCL